MRQALRRRVVDARLLEFPIDRGVAIAGIVKRSLPGSLHPVAANSPSDRCVASAADRAVALAKPTWRGRDESAARIPAARDRPCDGVVCVLGVKLGRRLTDRRSRLYRLWRHPRRSAVARRRRGRTTLAGGGCGEFGCGEIVFRRGLPAHELTTNSSDRFDSRSTPFFVAMTLSPGTLEHADVRSTRAYRNPIQSERARSALRRDLDLQPCCARHP